ncbi:MAG: MFS transporter [Ignavibacteriales bacterium]|nr:MFS transporter [Ignavibacteriales bacterium]
MNVNFQTIKDILRALKSRNYRLFFSGQGISLIGTWMQQIALGWLVYRLTDSAFLLGLVSFASQIPTFLLASFAGVLADRYDKHKIIIITQTFAMIQAAILSILTLMGIVHIWHIISLSILLGLINAFDMPTRQTFVIDLVEDKKDLPNAIALNSSMFNAARLIGPTIAGILISLYGEGICFLINAVSYIAVIIGLLLMRIEPKIREAKKEKVLRGLKEGVKYAYDFIPIRTLLILIAIISLSGMPYTVLMPIFAKDILHGNANTLGYLLGSVGIGAFTGAIYLASRKTVLGLGRLIAIASTIFAVGLLLFSFSTSLIFSIPLMFVAGLGMMMQMASSNTLLQTIVDDDKRGRIMSLYVMAFMGTAPFGSLIAGSLASKIGAPYTVLLSGITCLLTAFWFAKNLPNLRKHIRPVYVKMGIIQEVSSGLQSATHLNMPPNK